MLEIRDIDVFYGDAQALYQVSCTVGAGELVTLVGANGAGKTTILRAVAGIRPVARGDLLFEGESLRKVPAHRRPGLGIALVPEGRELWPQLTVRENLELGAYDRAARARRGESFAHVHELFPTLKHRAGQLAGSMSGGEQQMVAIGRALMSRPRLLMMDEPSLGLAPLVVGQMFAAIRRLHADGLTILLVEQNLARALRVADRGYVIETGRVSLSGTSDQLLSDPAVRAAYLGM
ncbi:ABC transporter ATP-binding protein [Actinoplanes awajinensis]|uniref:ABC transporter ATP-binding protein n=1 Tax=Actinoplanes awajinensis subsp. mycoplanecinus TaxID=135947 RepID=A0A0X3UNR7_9ACTN|nr:ABC transporter ATP-binding protein [Actinoplanes awajinensis]KUL34269.1 ABC transporter ATP-binding protein [Actinoplanes awajinensis subsp. mycoplanecinus]